MKKSRQREIEKASLAGIGGNLFLAVISIFSGLVFNSLALVGAGIDAATDIVSSIITLFTARIAAKPPDRDHPYGHSRAETIATKLLSFIIFFAGAQLALKSINSIYMGVERVIPEFYALIAAGVSVVGKVLLYVYKLKIGRRVNSSMLIADAKNMLSDVVLTGSVFAGIVLTRVFALPVLDLILACAVSLWIMRLAFTIFLESSQELMDGIEDREVYNQIFHAVNSVPGAGHPHRVRVRKLSIMYVVDLDIEVDGDINVRQGHDIARQVEKAIKENVKDVYDIIVHVEPRGNLESAEQYGLSENNIDE
ncbi:MAG: cation transporter [Spirochaetales bacterium]|nr:cation transporter [Spirochaetales bacterium]